jgi:hypothetical protein
MSQQEELIGTWSDPPEGGDLPIRNDDYISQVRQNCRLDLPNVKQVKEHDLIMVMVCGGPTSKLFLEDIRAKSKDPKYVIFCSNRTHDWLIENGIVPNYHFIIDPKSSMIDYVQHPNKDVEYLIGSCCNPGVFAALKDYKLKRLMTFSGSEDDDGMTDMKIIQTLFHKDEYAPLEGGTTAGLRAIPLGNIFGFRTIEFYGLDSGFSQYGPDGKPIFYSYDKTRIENILECKTDDGRIFESTPVFASQARQFIKWKQRFEWIKLIVHGDSLTAHIDKLDEEVNKPKHDLLLTDYARSMNEELHKDISVGYGQVGHEYAGEVVLLAGQLARKFGDITVLDYGCGNGSLGKIFPNLVGVTFKEYDPCIKEKSARPEPADLVVCTDVLEHIEPECLENVLDDLKRVVKKEMYLSICLTKAQKVYSDGQNCHLSILPEEIWYSKLRKRFDIVEMTKKQERRHHNLVYILQAKEVK